VDNIVNKIFPKKFGTFLECSKKFHYICPVVFQMYKKVFLMQTQIEKISAQLAVIAPDITRGDRKALREKYGFERGTISNYLNGRGVDADTGLLMLTFFKNRIAEREKAIA
jgi:hypothetical protein